MDTIRTKRLEIVNNNDKVVATLEAADKGAGLWINGPDGSLISVYSIEGQTAIGIYDKQGKNDRMGINFAMVMDNNEPSIQFRDKDGGAQFIKMADIKNAVTLIKYYEEVAKTLMEKK